jgi:hypothetical protein
MPILVAGNANGRVKGGRHVQYEGLPLSNLHMAILDMMSVSEQAYLSKDSDATGKLEGLGIAS